MPTARNGEGKLLAMGSPPCGGMRKMEEINSRSQSREKKSEVCRYKGAVFLSNSEYKEAKASKDN